jgi:putative endonuclease
MFYIYILNSESAGIYYIGHTDDPERRLFEHNNNPNNTFTSKYRPWNMVFRYPISEGRSEALKIERYLKNRKSKKLVNRLIENQSDGNYVDQLFKKIVLKNRK